MKNLITPLLGLFCLLWLNNAQADDYSEQCSEITVVYSNGMNTIEFDANEQRKDIRAFISSLDTFESFSMMLAYNPTEGPIDDFLDEVTYQLEFNKEVERWRSDNILLDGEIEESIHYQNFTSTIEGYVNNDALLSTVNEYLEYLGKGHCVVAVGYSQGNWVVNWAYDYVLTMYPQYQNQIKVIGIGTPAYRVAGENIIEDDYFYITSDSDAVINSRRSSFPILIPTVESVSIPFDLSFFENQKKHSLSSVYLAAPETRKAIANAFKCVAMIFLDHPASDGESSSSCKAYVTSDLNLIDGEYILSEETTSLSFKAMVTEGIGQQVQSVEVRFNNETLDTTGDNSYSFDIETLELTVNLTDIPAGDSFIEINLVNVEGGIIPVAQVNQFDAVGGLLYSFSENSVGLNLYREAEVDCPDYYNSDLLRNMYWSVSSTNLSYINGLPVNMKGNSNASIQVELNHLPEEWQECVDLNATISKWNEGSKSSYGNLDLRVSHSEKGVKFEIHGNVPDNFYRNIYNFYIVFQNGYYWNVNFNDDQYIYSAPAFANFPLLHCDVVDFYGDAVNEEWDSLRVCSSGSREFGVSQFDASVISSVSLYDYDTFLKKQEIFCDENGRCKSRNRDEYLVVSVEGLEVTYNISHYRDEVLIGTSTKTYTLGEH